MLFTPDSGDLAGHHFVVVDANGVAGYQANPDHVIEVAASHIDIGDFAQTPVAPYSANSFCASSLQGKTMPRSGWTSFFLWPL